MNRKNIVVIFLSVVVVLVVGNINIQENPRQYMQSEMVSRLVDDQTTERELIEYMVDTQEIKPIKKERKPADRGSREVKEVKKVKEVSRIFYTEITSYCACTVCTGKQPSDSTYGITATGARAREGRTVATDFNYLPIGTQLKIEGFGDTIFIVEDTFGNVNKGYRIDIFFDSHQRAIEYGRRRNVKVEIIK